MTDYLTYVVPPDLPPSFPTPFPTSYSPLSYLRLLTTSYSLCSTYLRVCHCAPLRHRTRRRGGAANDTPVFENNEILNEMVARRLPRALQAGQGNASRAGPMGCVLMMAMMMR